MAKNQNLNAASKAKKDEFYTRLPDIENELRHYQPHFRNKIVLCNCDDPFESEFFKYFALYFNHLGLKKLIATCYYPSPIVGREISLFDTPIEKPDVKRAFKVEIKEVSDWNCDGATDLLDVEQLIKTRPNVLKQLEGAGDFRSAECIELLKAADIVVTNPPFSLFREYVKQLFDFDKKFLIIGNINAITYKEIFPLIMANKLWLGYGFKGGNAYLSLPNGEYKNFAEGVYNSETGLVKFRNLCWFTNLDISKRHEAMILFRRYKEEPERYPRYDNYDAIEVSKTADIPCDYGGVMGVPITFLNKYCPEQFEILGHTSANDLSPAVEALRTDPKNRNRGLINGQIKYDRLLIRRRDFRG